MLRSGANATVALAVQGSVDVEKQSRMRRRQRNGGSTQHAQDSVPDAAVVVLDLNKKPVIKS